MDSQTIYRRRWVILSVLIVGLLAIVIDNTVLNVAMQTIAEPRGGRGSLGSVLMMTGRMTDYGTVAGGILVPEAPNREAHGIDCVGALLSIAGLVQMVYGIVERRDSAS